MKTRRLFKKLSDKSNNNTFSNSCNTRNSVNANNIDISSKVNKEK